MRALPATLRRQLEMAVLAGRRASESASRSALEGLGVFADRRPEHLDDARAALRNGLRAKWRQLGGDRELLVAECAYEQWHRLLFARFLAENHLLIHPDYGAPVSLDDCAELAAEFGEADGWALAARFAADILPGIFRLEDPCVRLRLAPEGRDALERILAALPGEVFAAPDSLGWVYQFWQKDKKEEVNSSERKIGAAELGPVTQLFTENYMVRFLLENSLGAWWAGRHPHSPLVQEFEYLRLGLDGKPAAGSFDNWPERVAEVTVIDPCCGSGHFLVEAFSLLWRMRAEEERLTPVDAQDAVLRDNLFGLELDPRCVQIAMFNIALQAWRLAGVWRQLPVPNIACSGMPVKAPFEDWRKFANNDAQLERALERLHVLFRDADTLGSLIDPQRIAELTNQNTSQTSIDFMDWQRVAPTVAAVVGEDPATDPASSVVGADLGGVARAGVFLARDFTLAATNVPFLSRSKQADNLRDYLETYSPLAKADLATAMLDRWIGACQTVAVVTPQNWQEKPGYTDYRCAMLARRSYNLFARIGNNAWQTQTGRQPFKVPTVLSIWSSNQPLEEQVIQAIDIGNGPAAQKAGLLRGAELIAISQLEQLSNPDARIVTTVLGKHEPLEGYAAAKQGVKTGDDPRYRRMFWEIPLPDTNWVFFQSSVVETQHYGGRSYILFWQQGRGDLAKSQGARIQGGDAWGKTGVVVSQMGDLFATLYSGDIFDSNAAAAVPKRPSDVPVLWAFLSSPEYRAAVRAIDNNVAVTNHTLVKVPFDVERWRPVAEGAGPLPQPSSQDPTQWLFPGRPESSAQPLHVAVARLLGYRWPQQPLPDDLDHLCDHDGIVCLPPVAGEPAGAERLLALLTHAFGGGWSSAKLKELLSQTGSRRKSLADWLSDEFFKQHCALFEDRPFIWHIGDGLRDGFSALLNYHRLDRKLLERLTYTHLGQDWIERQRAGVRDGVAGSEARLTAALDLRRRLEAILAGEEPHDIYVRWKDLHEQPLGWEPDINDGVRINIRPFVEAGVLRSQVRIHWRKDRGRNANGSERRNDVHFSLAAKASTRKSNNTS